MTIAENTAEIREPLVDRMKSVFGDDSRRIEHALAVLGHAESILAETPGADALVVTAAAVLHDIGIRAAERTHGSSAGRYQEIEGPPIAREILQSMDFDAGAIDHVCRIVANHHSARDIDTPEFRIIWDADWLVNIPDEYDVSDSKSMSDLIDRVFKTPKGRTTAQELFLRKE